MSIRIPDPADEDYLVPVENPLRAPKLRNPLTLRRNVAAKAGNAGSLVPSKPASAFVPNPRQREVTRTTVTYTRVNEVIRDEVDFPANAFYELPLPSVTIPAGETVRLPWVAVESSAFFSYDSVSRQVILNFPINNYNVSVSLRYVFASEIPEKEVQAAQLKLKATNLSPPEPSSQEDVALAYDGPSKRYIVLGGSFLTSIESKFWIEITNPTTVDLEVSAAEFDFVRL